MFLFLLFGVYHLRSIPCDHDIVVVPVRREEADKVFGIHLETFKSTVADNFTMLARQHNDLAFIGMYTGVMEIDILF